MNDSQAEAKEDIYQGPLDHIKWVTGSIDITLELATLLQDYLERIFYLLTDLKRTLVPRTAIT